jgi:hypothetical protein
MDPQVGTVRWAYSRDIWLAVHVCRDLRRHYVDDRAPASIDVGRRLLRYLLCVTAIASIRVVYSETIVAAQM